MSENHVSPSMTSAEAEYVAGQNLRASHEIMSLLERSKANVDEMLNRLPDIFVIIDAKGLIWKGNQAAADVFGVGREDLIKTHLSRLFDPETWKVVKTKLGIFLEGNPQGSSIEFELPMNGVKGPAREFFWNFRLYESGLSKQQSLVCVLGRDISQIRGYQRQMSQIFFSIPLGILTMNRDGVVVGPYSAYTEHLLGQDQLTGKSLKHLIFDPIEKGLSKAERDSVAALFECIGSEESWFNTMKVHFPIELPFRSKIGDEDESRWLGLSYHAICHAEKVDKVLVVIEDRTAVVQSRIAAERQKSKDEAVVNRILEISHCDERLLATAMEEMKELFDRLDEHVGGLDISRVCQTLHGIKGVARTAGFSRLKSMVHELEDLLLMSQRGERRLEDTMLQVRYMEVKMEWRQVASLSTALGTQVKSGPNSVASASEKYKQFREDVFEKVIKPIEKIGVESKSALTTQLDAIRSTLLSLLESIDKLALSEIEPRIKDKLEKTAERLGKPVQLLYSAPKILVESRVFLQILEILGHLVNNALDHGLESEEERKSLGKDPRGLIQLKIEQEGQNLCFTIADDGRGISPDGLKTVAVKRGLISAQEASQLSDEKALQLIVRPGFSTAVHVSDISGRGIGLDAVVEVIKTLGGAGLQITSEIHKGSKFSFRFPLVK